MSDAKLEEKKCQSWTKVEEIRLFKWMTMFKPAGVHKHFHMVCLLERINRLDEYPIKLLQSDKGTGGKVFSGEDVWQQLGKYYNLEKADEVENQPYPDIHLDQEENETDNETNDVDDTTSEDDYEVIPLQNRLLKETDFELPWEEYGELMLEHAKDHESADLNDEKPEEKLQATDTSPVPEDEETEKKPRTRRSARLTRSQRRGIDEDSENEDETSDIETFKPENQAKSDTPESPEPAGGKQVSFVQNSESEAEVELEPERKEETEVAVTHSETDREVQSETNPDVRPDSKPKQKQVDISEPITRSKKQKLAPQEDTLEDTAEVDSPATRTRRKSVTKPTTRHSSRLRTRK